MLRLADDGRQGIFCGFERCSSGNHGEGWLTHFDTGIHSHPGRSRVWPCWPLGHIVKSSNRQIVLLGN